MCVLGGVWASVSEWECASVCLATYVRACVLVRENVCVLESLRITVSPDSL